jgi:hypothetical protein
MSFLGKSKRPASDSPKTLASNVTMEQLLSKYDEMMQTIVSLKTLVENSLVFKPPDALFVNSLSPIMKNLANNSIEAYALLRTTATIREAAQAYEKNFCAVIEHLPDSDTDSTKLDSDQKYVNDICDKAGIEKPLEVWRHEPKRQNADGNKVARKKPRIIKVKFSTKAARNEFLRKFTKNRAIIPNSRNPTVRRDMTPTELNLLYLVRRQAYEANREVNKFMYVVHDLNIVELANPQPLRRAIAQ